jgi:hypothetical protein
MSTCSGIILQPFHCAAIKRLVTLDQDAHVPDPENDPERAEWVTVWQGFRDCRYRHNCPVVEPPNHSGRIKWELCPGREKYEHKDPE